MPALKATPAIRRGPEPVAIARPRLPTLHAIAPYLERIDATRRYANFGPLNAELEQRLAERLAGDARVVTLANGTVALSLALRAAGARPGTLCILPSWTFVASAHAVLDAGLTPYFVDVDPETWMLDPAVLPAAIAAAPDEIGAIMPVAAFGRMPDLAAWRRVADALELPVIVDGAAAFDALTAAPVPITVSLHATKTVAAGEGGYVASDDAALIDRVRSLSAFGFNGTRIATRPACNAKLSEYGAAVALASLDGWLGERASFAFAAQRLRAGLAMTPQARFQPGWGAAWISSVCVVGTPEGAAPAIASAMANAGVETRAWWNAGCHLEPAFADCPRTSLPVTERLAVSTLGLPYYVDLDAAAAARVAEALMEALRHG